MGDRRFGINGDRFVYKKPSLHVISVKGDETLASGCKTIGGRTWPGTQNCGAVSSCNQLGS